MADVPTGMAYRSAPAGNHRYDELYGHCSVCGRDRYQVEHFNGDAEAAKLALDRHTTQQRERERWVRELTVGQPVMVGDDYPTPAMQGMVGQVVELTTGPQGAKYAQVKFPNAFGQYAIALKWLVAVPLPEPPPKFTSQDEADRWLEDTAKEMGLRTERRVPHFSSPEEAEEWMERQAGEPFVPPSWLAGPADTIDARMFRLLQQAIVPASGRRGPSHSLVILDEVQDF